MAGNRPRGIAVTDIGASNSKIVLFDADLKPVAERKTASRHGPPPPYLRLDPEPLARFLAAALPELDRILPIDIIVPCAHGAALACLNKQGALALPVMDYLAEPPPEIVAQYRTVEPPFSEVFCPVLPAGLTCAIQLFWQQTAFAEKFAAVSDIMPWVQYVTFMLSGVRICEITGLASHSQLIDVKRNEYSSLSRRQGWDKLFAPRRNAWEIAGPLKPEFRGGQFQGRGEVLAGIHDSNANYLRYLAAGMGDFTLLSSGTWIIGFDTSADLDALTQDRDTVTNTDILGRPVACFRFFGGREYEIVAEGAPAEAASVAAVARLIARGTFALPSFTDSGGPMPGTGNKGRVTRPKPESEEERSSLAALYCALMSDQSLAAINSAGALIVDGPFAKNETYLAVLAALRPNQPLHASQLRDGTTAGAAILALMVESGTIPSRGLALDRIEVSNIAGLEDYAKQWLHRSVMAAL